MLTCMEPDAYEEMLRLRQEMENVKLAAERQLLAEREELEVQYRAALAELDRKLADVGYVAGKGAAQTRRKPHASAKAHGSGIAAVCQVCGFQTVPPHDQRFRLHKRQEQKAPLTDAELTAAGMRRGER